MSENNMITNAEKDMLKNIKIIFTDMDGTLTTNGELNTRVINAINNLKQKNILTIIVTGRSAGWLTGLVSLLPVAGAIAENGGVYIVKDMAISEAREHLLFPITNLSEHRNKLTKAFNQIQIKYPELKVAPDNNFRLTDFTFSVNNLTKSQLEDINNICKSLGFSFTYSTVQCHIMPNNQSKLDGIQQVIQEYYSNILTSNSEYLTIGDSPNDESMFNPFYFPKSFGVANIVKYLPVLTYKPKYILTAQEGEGFIEMANMLGAEC